MKKAAGDGDVVFPARPVQIDGVVQIARGTRRERAPDVRIPHGDVVAAATVGFSVRTHLVQAKTVAIHPRVLIPHLAVNQVIVAREQKRTRELRLSVAVGVVPARVRAVIGNGRLLDRDQSRAAVGIIERVTGIRPVRHVVRVAPRQRRRQGGVRIGPVGPVVRTGGARADVAVGGK